MTNDPDQIRADIERTRENLSSDVNALADEVNPRNIAQRQVNKVTSRVTSVKERVMGSNDDPYAQHTSVGDRLSSAQGTLSDKASSVQGTVGDKLSSVGDAASGAPSQVRAKAQGNPLAAGVIAFGVGWLVSSLLPSSAKEREAAEQVKQAAKPLAQEAQSAAREVADNLREPAQQAAQSVKGAATDAAQTVKEEGTSAAQDVKGDAQSAKDNVQESRQA
jgi:gas vesicle protein